MSQIKVHTTGKRRNYVRYFLSAFVLMTVLIACEKLDTGSDDPRDNLLGTWSCNENSQEFGNQSYEVEISKSTTDSAKIFIDNFYGQGSGFSVYARINGLNLTIPSQTVDHYQISGSGSISSNYSKISLSYNSTIEATTDHVTATYLK